MQSILQPLLGRIYYGWVMLLTVSITEVVSWGILYYAFAVFVAPMQADLGWSQIAITGAYSLALLCSGVAAVPVGRWLDRHGPRALMTCGSIAATVLLVAWSQVQSVWIFYAIMAGIGITSAAVLYDPAFAIVAVWFRRKRGRALTLLTFFGAWASVVFIPLSAWLVSALGWRTALLVLAGILGGITIAPHALILRRRPEDRGLLPDGDSAVTADSTRPAANEQSVPVSAALREPGFWWLTIAFAISTFATVALTVHLIPYLIERGQSPEFAAMVAGMFGLMSLAGRLLIGPLGDRYPRHLIMAGLIAMQIAGLAALVLAPTAAGALVFVALFGAGSGTQTIMRAALLAERYGAEHYGSINGVLNLALTGARTLAPVGAGALAALLGGYPGLLWALISLSGAGIAGVLKAGETKHSTGAATEKDLSLL